MTPNQARGARCRLELVPALHAPPHAASHPPRAAPRLAAPPRPQFEAELLTGLTIASEADALAACAALHARGPHTVVRSCSFLPLLCSASCCECFPCWQRLNPPSTPTHPSPTALCRCCRQVITSSDLPGWRDHVTVLASTTQLQAGGGPQRLRLRVPRVHAYFTGTGALRGVCVGGAAAECMQAGHSAVM